MSKRHLPLTDQTIDEARVRLVFQVHELNAGRPLSDDLDAQADDFMSMRFGQDDAYAIDSIAARESTDSARRDVVDAQIEQLAWVRGYLH